MFCPSRINMTVKHKISFFSLFFLIPCRPSLEIITLYSAISYLFTWQLQFLRFVVRTERIWKSARNFPNTTPSLQSHSNFSSSGAATYSYHYVRPHGGVCDVSLAGVLAQFKMDSKCRVLEPIIIFCLGMTEFTALFGLAWNRRADVSCGTFCQPETRILWPQHSYNLVTNRFSFLLYVMWDDLRELIVQIYSSSPRFIWFQS